MLRRWFLRISDWLKYYYYYIFFFRPRKKNQPPHCTYVVFLLNFWTCLDFALYYFVSCYTVMGWTVQFQWFSGWLKFFVNICSHKKELTYVLFSRDFTLHHSVSCYDSTVILENFALIKVLCCHLVWNHSNKKHQNKSS